MAYHKLTHMIKYNEEFHQAVQMEITALSSTDWVQSMFCHSRSTDSGQQRFNAKNSLLSVTQLAATPAPKGHQPQQSYFTAKKQQELESSKHAVKKTITVK